MPSDEVEHRAEHRGIGKPGAQVVGCEAGQRQQPARAIVVSQHPAERGERQRSRIDGGG